MLKGQYTRTELGVKRGNIQWKAIVDDTILLFVNEGIGNKPSSTYIYQNHLDIVGKIFAYQDENDSQSVQLQEKLSTMDFQRLIEEVTGLSNKKIILEIELVIKKYKNDSK